MSTTSPNLGLTLATPADVVDVVGQIANNFSIIDGITINGIKIAPSTTLTIAAIGGGNITGNLNVSGNVGIGTTAPLELLHIHPGTNQNILVYGLAPGIQISSVNDANGSFEPLLIDGNTTIINANSGADFYTNAWADYSVSSTIVGWSASPTATIYTKKIGKSVLVIFKITGTSNSTSTSFTVPYSAATTSAFTDFSVDNGTASISVGQIAASSSTVTLYKDPASDNWTASGTKTVQGQFWYQST